MVLRFIVTQRDGPQICFRGVVIAHDVPQTKIRSVVPPHDAPKTKKPTSNHQFEVDFIYYLVARNKKRELS